MLSAFGLLVTKGYADAMKHELRIEVLEPNTTNFMLYRRTAPAGVEVGPLSSDAQNLLNPDTAALFFVVVWQTFGPTATDIAKDVLKEVTKDALKKWAVDFITKLNARRVRINQREPKDASDLECIISEEIDIGKND